MTGVRTASIGGVEGVRAGTRQREVALSRRSMLSDVRTAGKPSQQCAMNLAQDGASVAPRRGRVMWSASHRFVGR